MKTSINLDFKFLAHRIFLNLRIGKNNYQPGYKISNTTRKIKHDQHTLAKSNHSRRHERLLRCRRTTE